MSAALPSGSPQAFLFAACLVGLATLARVMFGWIGATLYFATFFPAILLTALIAGRSAAVAATALTAVVVWCAFLPANEVFSALSITDVANYAMFFLASGLIIWLAHAYRQTVDRLGENERQRELMMKELEHRGKNTFFVIEAIVRRTLEDAPERAEAIVGRIHAVQSTNDIIYQNPEQRASLRSIIRNEFVPHGAARLHYSGAEVELPADTACGLALVFHELVTNAVKYGALSTPGGSVRVACETAEETVTVRWQELGGPEVSPPRSAGFGTRLVTRTVQALSGAVTAEWQRSGLTCTIEFRNAP